MQIIAESTGEVRYWNTMDDVDDNQFFIDFHGRLCQKINDCSYNVIADENHNPCAEETQVAYIDEEISEVLPNISLLSIIERNL